MFQTASRVPVGAPALTAVRHRDDARSRGVVVCVADSAAGAVGPIPGTFGVPVDGTLMSTTKGGSATTLVIARGPAARGAPV